MRAILAIVVLLGGCSMLQMSSTPKYEDGQVPIPADYKSWPKFLSAVQRPDAKQVREIYVNPQGHATKAGAPFPNGTVMVMENYAVVVGADGNPVPGADGKLQKANLAKIFVMARGEGYGAQVPDGLKNGNWVYAAYDAAGAKTADNLTTCRACHLPLTSAKDFVHRYDEYFASRGK